MLRILDHQKELNIWQLELVELNSEATIKGLSFSLNQSAERWRVMGKDAGLQILSCMLSGLPSRWYVLSNNTCNCLVQPLKIF
ncbi:hypothetical protein CK203_037883 [Vitis vinifera]|uniref:Uncharacterized protein n=1 Tax=Vitis vinifera TaxID=29760 RepID=A0A438ICB4_VITVI|nr:hypothetical protein CK203_037883 [Vitis vinifera]